VGIRQGFLGGLVVGITNGVAFFAYALALWYGSTRVEAGDYTGAPPPRADTPLLTAAAGCWLGCGGARLRGSCRTGAGMGAGRCGVSWKAREPLTAEGCSAGRGLSCANPSISPNPTTPPPNTHHAPPRPSAPGGDVVNVLFSALIGGFALGQAAPNVQYFQQGKVAGARIFEIMGRRPDIDFDADGGCCWGKEAALAVSWHWRSLPAGTAGRGPAGPTVPASGMATPPLPAAAQARF
jgi:hypothetical protein